MTVSTEPRAPRQAGLWAVVAVLGVGAMSALVAAAILAMPAAPAALGQTPDQAFAAAVRSAAEAQGVPLAESDESLVATGREMCAQMTQSGLDARSFGEAIVTATSLDEQRGRLAIATADAAAAHLCPQ